MISNLFVKDIDEKADKFMQKQLKKARKEAKRQKKASEQIIENLEESNTTEIKVDDKLEIQEAIETHKNSDISPKKIRNNADKILESKKTIFVGNVDLSLTKNNQPLRDLFGAAGVIESLRFRSIPRSRLLKRKDAANHQEFNTKRKTCNAYIIFKQEDSVEAAISLNGTELLGHVLRVDKALQRKQDSGVFVGNLPPSIEEVELHQHFEDCGNIDYVRVIRDPQMNMCKGIAYVVFKDPSAIRLALRLSDSVLKERKIRVTNIQSNPKANKKAITGKDVAKRLKKLKKNK
eukprot:NODE_481_length_6950_cov_0.533353.p3 type:complete len:291 gc:universal NODE_481_length_6950_cov_0.533353:1591-2463(+)